MIQVKRTNVYTFHPNFIEMYSKEKNLPIRNKRDSFNSHALKYFDITAKSSRKFS